MNDLWLDEIFSHFLASSISSPLKILTGLHSDNNHYLNTLFLYLYREHGNWAGYRIPSIIAGVCMVVMGWFIGRRRSRANAIILMSLLGASYPLILWSSEARGYAEVAFFSLLSYFFLSRYLERQTVQEGVLFSISAVLGFLSHAVFLLFYLSALAWTAYRLLRLRPKAKHLLASILICHALPVATLALLYVLDLRIMNYAEGAGGKLNAGEMRWSTIERFGDAFAWTLGTALPSQVRLPLCLAAFALLIIGIVILWRSKSDEWILFSAVIVIVPVAFLLILRPDFVYVRYFIESIVFLLVLISILLASVFERKAWGKTVCILFIAGYCAVNAWHVGQLFIDGRGHYAEAVSIMGRSSHGHKVTVGGDRDYQIGPVLDFYVPLSNEGKDFVYYNQGTWTSQDPEWIILQRESFEATVSPHARQIVSQGSLYELSHTFPTAPLSGLHWFLYHKKP